MTALDARVSVGFYTHPKTKKLARRVGFEGPWCLLGLWLYARQNRPDGVLGGMTAEDLEIAVDWRGKAGEFVRALTEVGFLDNVDGVYQLHDWAEHQPWASGSKARSDSARLAGLIRQYGDEKGRQMFHADQAKRLKPSSGPVTAPLPFVSDPLAARSATPSGPDSPVSVSVSVSVTSPYPLLSAQARAKAFAQFWDAYPKKRSKGQAERAWSKLPLSEHLLQQILTALETAKKTRDWIKESGAYVPYPATWLNARGWEDDLSTTAPTASAKNGAGADDAWTELRKATNTGRLPARWSDPRIEAALEAIGGWGKVKFAETRELDFMRKRFVDAFNQAAH
jgi:hypothetical protein